MVAVIDVLREKMTNMAKWIEGEIEDAGDLVSDVSEMSNTKMMLFASELQARVDTIRNRDWNSLLLEDFGGYKTTFFRIFLREDMHDKLWRYLELFVVIISNE